MKRSSPLWGSVSVLIGVVIAILALVRGAWLVPLLLLVFTAWGLWVVMFQLQPAWDSIRGYRKKEHDARRQREASLYSTAQANADAMQLLLRHVNHRISAYLKSVYGKLRFPILKWSCWTRRAAAPAAPVSDSAPCACARCSCRWLSGSFGMPPALKML